LTPSEGGEGAGEALIAAFSIFSPFYLFVCELERLVVARLVIAALLLLFLLRFRLPDFFFFYSLGHRTAQYEFNL
jgi:hypothetical protein